MDMTETLYWARHGQTRDYCWIESNGILLSELLSACPDVVEGQYVVRSYHNSAFLVPFGLPPGVAWEKWYQDGLIGIVASASEISGDGYDEFFVYKDCPDNDFFRVLKEDEVGLSGPLICEEANAAQFWERLIELGPESYISNGELFRFVTRNGALFEKFIGSNAVVSVPKKHKVEAERNWQVWLKSVGGEVGPEKCEELGCERLRIKLSLRCGRHHLDMLERSGYCPEAPEPMMTEEEISDICSSVPGAKELFDWFGYWPGFHDGEVLQVHLNRSGESLIRIHHCAVTSEVDEDGYFKTEKHVIVSFKLSGINEIELYGFNYQNSIGELSMERVGNEIIITVSANFGLGGRIRCERVSIELTPGRPGSEE